MLDVTPTHLSRPAKAACGRSAAEMLTERVGYAARDMLSEPEPPVGEVAEALGFNSAAYFSRFVQTHTGATPTDLRARAGRDAPAAPLAGHRP